MGKNKTNEPIAVIGIGCRFPGDCDNPQEFWNMLIDKTDAIVDIPKERWDKELYFHPDKSVKGKMIVKQGGFIKDIDMFDASFFGIPPIEARRMDPQQRLLLEKCFMAVEDAGLKLENISNTSTGVFIGISTQEYSGIQNDYFARNYIDVHTNTGGALSIAANRISYMFNLKGPSFAVDTACSSSLVALHLGCQSIWNNESEMAFIGGVNTILKPEIHIGFSTAGFLAPDCRCKSFDASANGYVRSEGIGVVLLKPLKNALKDRDNIYCTVVGSALNEDGRTTGIAMPNTDSQQKLIAKVYNNASIDVNSVDYIEAHGTGTAVGDPIEGNSIGRTLCTKRSKTLYVGSVKSNIGHLESGSGIAGFCKLALSLKNRVIPPNIHFKNPNPEVFFEKYKITIPTDIVEFKGSDEIVGGINSFGFGGANAHVIVKSLADNSSQINTDNKLIEPLLFSVSAQIEEALKKLVEKNIDFIIENQPGFTDFCYSSVIRRSVHRYTVSFSALSNDDIIKKLKLYLNSPQNKEISTAKKILDGTEKVGLVFSGQGAQWYAMGRKLLNTDESFYKQIQTIDSMLEELGWLDGRVKLIDELLKDENESRINKTEIAQPAIFAVQIGLYNILKTSGLKVHGIVGHSIGEVAAAYASGALSLEEAVRIVYWRSRCQSILAGRGTMVSIALSAEDYMSKFSSIGAEVAAVNGSDMITVAGSHNSVEALLSMLEKEGVFYRVLDIDIPFHCNIMEELESSFKNGLKEVNCNNTDISFYSTVTGNQYRGSELDNNYWYENIRKPVLFKKAISNMTSDGISVFIEISAHPILSRYLEEELSENSLQGIVCHTLNKKLDDDISIQECILSLRSSGVNLNLEYLYPESAHYIQLPHYPWQKEKFWIEPEQTRVNRIGLKYHPHLKRRQDSAVDKNSKTWEVELDHRSQHYIADHKVQGPIVYPGAGHVELAFAAGIELHGMGKFALENIRFDNPLFLNSGQDPYHVQLSVTSDLGRYGVSSKKTLNDFEWKVHSTGFITPLPESKIKFDEIIDTIRHRVKYPVDVDGMISSLIKDGLMLGQSFRGLQELWSSDGEALGKIIVPESIIPDFSDFNIHPALLDASFQSAFGIIYGKGDFGVHIPIKIRKIRVFDKAESNILWSYAKSVKRDHELLICDIIIFDSNGKVLIEIEGFTAKYLKGSREEREYTPDQMIYNFKWFMEDSPLSYSFRNTVKSLKVPCSLNKVLSEAVDEIKSTETDRRFRNEFTPLLYELTHSLIYEAMMELGIVFKPKTRIEFKELINKVGLSKRHLKLFSKIIETLISENIFEQKDEFLIVKNMPSFRTSSELVSIIRDNYKEFMPEVELVVRCGINLPDILKDKVDPLTLLFPEDDWDTTLKYYIESYTFKKYNIILCKALEFITGELSPNRTLRILEIGAGTGGVTGSILPILPQCNTEYYFTDVSGLFLDKAKHRFKDFPFVKYSLLNIEECPLEQGFYENSFDIVIASDVIHATKYINRTLDNIEKLICPGGQIIFLEVTKLPPYVDILFGLTEGWWLFEDYDIRPNQCTMSINQWQLVLQKRQYDDINLISDINDVDDDFGQTCFFLQKNKELKIKPLEAEHDIDHFWLCLSDESDKTELLREYLYSKGAGLEVINVEGNESIERNISDTLIELSDNKKFKGVIYIPSTNNDLDNLNFNKYVRLVKIFTDIVKYLHNSRGLDLDVWIITSQSQKVLNDDKVFLDHSPLWGIGRVAINEPPHIAVKLVDISENLYKNEIRLLAQELVMSCGNTEIPQEIAYRNDCRYILKMVRDSSSTYSEKIKVKAEEYSFEANFETKGILNSVYFKENELQPLKNDEVIVKNLYSPLNFRDIMLGNDRLPDTAQDNGIFLDKLGLEFAGEILKKGVDVHDLQVGERVIGFASGCISGKIKAKSYHCTKIPPEVDLLDISTTPMAYLTAYFSLVNLGDIDSCTSILIHSAAGGVGSAAIEIARKFNLKIFCTANVEKHNYLQNKGIKYIFDSHSYSYSEEILELTDGLGVDLILNSLSGMHITKSLKCLAPFGRFIEIGKSDLHSGSQIDLSLLKDSQCLMISDIDRLLKERPDVCKKIMSEVVNEIAKGEYGSLPYTLYDVSNIKKAFKHFSNRHSFGKAVLDLNNELEIVPLRKINIKSNASYLIIGGTGGFGLSTAEWLHEKGAQNIHLVGRTGLKKHADTTIIERMKSNGCNVTVHLCDVSKLDEVKCLIEKVDSQTPLKGVFNSAMVLGDELLTGLTQELIEKVMKPKVLGSWNLHISTKNLKLDYFIMYSSVASMFGTPGQGNYAAANAYMDQLSYYRNNLSLPSITINWGVLGEVGFVSRNKKVETLLEGQGLVSMPKNIAFSVLEQALDKKPVHQGVFIVDWKKIKEAFPKSGSSCKYMHLMTGDSDKNKNSNSEDNISDRIKDLSSDEQKDLAEKTLKKIIGRIIDIEPEKIESSVSIVLMGLDSLMLNQLRSAVLNIFSIDIPLMMIMQGPSVDSLVKEIIIKITESSKTQDLSVNDIQTQKWIIRSEIMLNPKVRLFCFPYMGSGASIFKDFQASLGGNIEVCSIQLPGREERIDEKSIASAARLFKELDRYFLNLTDIPFAFYGHSFGANLAFSYSIYLKIVHGIAPKHLFLGASIPADIINPLDNLTANSGANDNIKPALLTDEQVITLLKKLHVPDKFFNNTEHLAKILPTIKSDLKLAREKEYISGYKSDTPITLFAGEYDDIYPVKLQEKWKEYTNEKFSLEKIKGGHLFIHDEELCSIVLKKIKEVMI